MAVQSDSEKEDLKSQESFDAGFNDKAPADKGATAAAEPTLDTPPKNPDLSAASAADKVEDKPELVTLTKTQLAKLEASATDTEALKKQLASLSGNVGNIHQVIKKLQAVTPAGETITLPEDIGSYMGADFPELGKLLRKELEQAFKAGMRGTGTADPADGEAVKTAIQDRVKALQIEALEDAYPDWRNIVGAVSDGKFDPAHPFRSWLATQPKDFQARLNHTDNAVIIERAITKFMDQKRAQELKAPAEIAPKLVARKGRIQAAIQPRGDGAPAPAAMSVEDAFNEGFNSG